MGSVQVLATGIALGISIAAPPGPVTALAAQQVATRSWFAGWSVTAGATLADGVFFVLTYFGVARLVTAEERSVLFLLGGILLSYLAVSTAGKARHRSSPQAAVPSRGGRSPLVIGLTMGLTNPYQLGWWVAVGAGMVSEFGSSVAVGFFVGIVSWTLAMTWAVRASVARYQRLVPAVAYASAALMAGFGVWFIVSAALTFL